MSFSTLTKGLPKFLSKPVNDDLSTRGNGLEKWQIALLIGSPIVIGAVFYYYHNRKTIHRNDKKLPRDKLKKDGYADANQVTELTDPYNLAIHHKNQGNKLFKQGKYDEALDCYSKAIECCPKDKTSDLSIFYQNRAAVYETNKNYEAVVEECSKAIKLNRKYIKALQRRAKAYESMGYISDALRDITAVDILEGFQNKNNLLMTDRLLKQLSKTKSKEYFSNRPFSMPSKHFIKNYFSSYCRDPLVKNTEDLDGDKLYSILEELRSEKLLEEKPGNASAKCSLLEGTIDILKGNISEGERKLELILGFGDVDIDVKVNALIKLGTIKVQEVDGNSEGLNSALDCFKQAIELDSNNQDIYIHRAQIYLLAEKIDEALEDLEKCCSLAPDFPSAISQRLYVTYRIAFRSEDYERIKELLKGFEDALAQFPTSTEVYSLYAQMLTEQGDYAKADKLFLKAIECDPKDANLIVHRGILAMQTNFDFEKARDLLEQALKIDNKCTFAHEMLGTLEVQRGNLTKGIECFDKALENSSTEMDCAHLFSLREAAVAQISAVESLGISLTPR